VVGEAVGCAAEQSLTSQLLAATVVAGLEDRPDDERADGRAEDLAHEVGGDVPALGALQRPHADGDRRVDVTARDVAEQIRRAEQAQTEGE